MEYHRPKSFAEALPLLSKFGDSATVIAGGTDLIVDMKFRGFRPSCLININSVKDLSYVEENGEGLKIGALTSIQALKKNELLQKEYTGIADAARQFASLQIRNLATVGGNLVRSSPCGEMAPPLITLDATVIIASEKKEREVELVDFFLGPGQNVLEANELLREIRLQPLPARTGSSYWRLSYRDVLDLAIVGVGSRVTLDADNRVTKARVALGAVAPKPIRAEKTEALLKGQLLDENLIVEAGKMASQEATPISDQRSSADYRTNMTAVLTRRSLRSAAAAAAKS